MPGQKVEEPGSMDWETVFLCLAYSSRDLAMVLANKNNPATPGTCNGGDNNTFPIQINEINIKYN